MTLKWYDEALENKLSRLFSNVISASPDEAMYLSNKNGKVTLPLISMYRMSNSINWEDYNFAESNLTGWNSGSISSDQDDSIRELIMTKAIPVDLTYQIDIWSSDRETLDHVYHDLVFTLLVRPNIKVDMHNQLSNKIFALRLTGEQYSTDISQFNQSNRLYRYSLTYQVNDARLLYNEELSYKYEDVSINIAIKANRS